MVVLFLYIAHSTLHPQFRVQLMQPLHIARHGTMRLVCRLPLTLIEDTFESKFGKTLVKVGFGSQGEQAVARPILVWTVQGGVTTPDQDRCGSLLQDHEMVGDLSADVVGRCA